MVQIYSQKAARRKEVRRIEWRDYERGTESRHAPPPSSTGREKENDLYVDDSGSKLQKVSQRSFGRGRGVFPWSKQFTEGTYAIAGRKNNLRVHKEFTNHSTRPLKALDRNPIHVVKPQVLTNCKPHQRSDRSF